MMTENPLYKLDPRRYMIVVSHPNRTNERRMAIGYWSNIKEGMGGVNFAVEMASSLLRGAPLPHPSNFVDANWDKEERGMVVDYLKSGPTQNRIQGARDGAPTKLSGPRVIHNWRGWSNCRICGCKNGSTCVGDDKFIWPSGFAHYIERHGVRPPREFVDHVRGQVAGNA